MNKDIRKMYFEMQGKVIFPENKGQNNRQFAATVAANFASIGYPMTTEQIKLLARADTDDIKVFYEENYQMFRDILGADRIQKPFYPDFPKGCMKRDAVEYFIDQIVYGLSGLMLEPSVYMEEKKKYPFIGTPMHRILMEGSMDDLHNTFKLAVNSPIAYSKMQRDFIRNYVAEYPENISELIGMADTKNRENAVTCAMLVEEFSKNSIRTKSFMKQPADLLRYAAFKAVQKEDPDRDPYLAIALRDTGDNMPRYSVSRPERAFIMNTLAEMANGNGEKLSNKMSGHDTEWNRLFKKLHVTDKAWAGKKYDAVKRAIVIIQSGERLDRPARRIEEAVKAGDVETAVKESMRMPGEFMRRFDKLYRMAIEKDKADIVLDAMNKVASAAGIATVTGTIGSLEQRDKDDTMRYFKAKSGKTYNTDKKNRKAFTQEQLDAAINTAMKGLSEKFEGKAPMGRVFVSDTIKDVKIPVDIRNASAGIGVVTSGSKMPVPDDWTFIRFFVGWTNMKPLKNNVHTRIDIDLTTTFCDKDMNRVDFCGWNGGKADDGYLYSGDVQDGGPWNKDGRAEFIDIDMEVLRKRGVKYVIPQINSYTGQKFREQPNTCFGVMKRSKADMGKPYEPVSVVNRFVLDTESTMAMPYMIDIEENQIIWMNASADSNVALRSFGDIERMVGKTQSSAVMSLDKLVKANVIANGEFVFTPAEADLVFVRDTDEMAEVKEKYEIKDDNRFILSSNMEFITGYLMN